MRSLRKLPRHSRRLAVLGAAAAASVTGLAGVTISHEGGPTGPIGQYLAVLPAQPPVAPDGAVPAQASTLPMGFPIATPSMRPGSLHATVRRCPGRRIAALLHAETGFQTSDVIG